jgi:hypothetical protein
MTPHPVTRTIQRDSLLEGTSRNLLLLRPQRLSRRQTPLKLNPQENYDLKSQRMRSRLKMGTSSSYVRSAASSSPRGGLWAAMPLGFIPERARHTAARYKEGMKGCSRENFYSSLSKSIRKYLDLMLLSIELKSESSKETLELE